MTWWRHLRKDFSFSAVAAALIVVLVGMTSSAVIVFQAAQAFGASAAEAGSWLGSVCVGIGLLSILLSLRYRVPVLIAWSTPGAVLLVSSAQGFTMGEAIGAFLASSFFVFLFGLTGWFEKIMDRISLSLTSALLAGVLLHFCLDVFGTFQANSLLVGSMLLVYVLGRRFWPQMTMFGVLLVGLILAASLGLFHLDEIHFSLTEFYFFQPEFSWQALISLGIPLFIVTMASQNLTGLSVMKAHHYKIPISTAITSMGVVGLVTSVFGGFSINFAAITAAMAMGKDVHANPERRYVAAVMSGLLYVVLGIFAGAIASFFSAFPKVMIVAVAGFALFQTVSAGLEKALSDPEAKEASFLTFAIAASGFSFWGVGSAFWAILVGVLAQLLLRPKNRTN